MNKTHHLLREWGEFVSRHINFADEDGENFLVPLIEYGYTDSQPGKDLILCPDMPRRLQKVGIAVNHLSELRKNVITLWFASPLNVDGHPWNLRELADMCMISMSKFTYELGKAQKDVTRLLK